MESERVHRVVNNDKISKVVVLEYAQIFYVESFFSLNAVISVKSFAQVLVLRVNVVENSVRIRFM